MAEREEFPVFPWPTAQLPNAVWLLSIASAIAAFIPFFLLDLSALSVLLRLVMVAGCFLVPLAVWFLIQAIRLVRVALARAELYDDLCARLAHARAESRANRDAADSLVRIMLSGLGKPATIRDAVWESGDACLIVDLDVEAHSSADEVLLAIDPRDASVLGVFRLRTDVARRDSGQAATAEHILDPLWWAHVRQSAQARVPLVTRAIMLVVSHRAERRLAGGS